MNSSKYYEAYELIEDLAKELKDTLPFEDYLGMEHTANIVLHRSTELLKKENRQPKPVTYLTPQQVSGVQESYEKIFRLFAVQNQVAS